MQRKRGDGLSVAPLLYIKMFPTSKTFRSEKMKKLGEEGGIEAEGKQVGIILEDKRIFLSGENDAYRRVVSGTRFEDNLSASSTGSCPIGALISGKSHYQ